MGCCSPLWNILALSFVGFPQPAQTSLIRAHLTSFLDAKQVLLHGDKQHAYTQAEKTRMKVNWYFESASLENVSFPEHLPQQGSPAAVVRHLVEQQTPTAPLHPPCRPQVASKRAGPLSGSKRFGPAMKGAGLSTNKAYDAAASKKKKEKKKLHTQSFLSGKQPHGCFFIKSLFSHLGFRIENWFLFILPVYRFSLSSSTSAGSLALTFVLELSKTCNIFFSD